LTMLMFFTVCFFHVFYYTLKNMFFNVFYLLINVFIIYAAKHGSPYTPVCPDRPTSSSRNITGVKI